MARKADKLLSEVIREVGTVLSVTRSPHEDAKCLDAVSGTISGTIGQFEQFDDSISPLESTCARSSARIEQRTSNP